MSSDDTTTPVAVGLVIIVAAAIAASVLLLPIDNDTERIVPADTTQATPPSTVWQTTLLPPALSVHATVATPALRSPQIQVSEPPPAPPTTTIPIPPHYETWLQLAECESGGDWAINTGNGYYGGLQFSLTSWRGAGGWQHAPRPDLATPLDQMWAAEVLLGFQGWGAWPACSRKLGLR